MKLLPGGAAAAAAAVLLLPSLLREVVAYTALSEQTLLALPEPGDGFDIHTGSILAPILRPRVPGSEGSQAVQSHFLDFFRKNLPEWTVTLQNSSATTPTSHGKLVPFTNIIATRDPPWASGDGDVGRLALVAHYDSKLTPDGFIGATDSAAPCAMLLHAAQSLDDALTRKWAGMKATMDDLDDGVEAHRGVQILLLDGEEAFKTWSHTDSLYGAKSLAKEWETPSYSAWGTYQSPLRAIELFVLLDLLGASNPRVPSYFKTTHWAYKKMADAELRLREAGKFRSSPNHASKRQPGGKAVSEPMFLHQAAKSEAAQWAGGIVEDDHLPFMARGVEILHLIASPFPRVWHTMEDDGEHLDMDVCNDWALLTIAFMAEWMDLEGYMDTAPATGKPARRLVAEVDKSEL